MSSPTTSSNDLRAAGIAFALTIAAGASTAIGASVVFFPRLVRLASRRTLAAALGLSAGVMTYVSFVEILKKCYTAFVDSGYDPDREALVYTTLTFFGGVILMVILNTFVTWLLGGHHHHHDDDHHVFGDSHNDERRTGASSQEDESTMNVALRPTTATTTTKDSTTATTTKTIKEEEDRFEKGGEGNGKDGDDDDDEEEEVIGPRCACCSEDPAGDLREIHRMAEEIERYEQREHHEWEGAQAVHHHGHHHNRDHGEHQWKVCGQGKGCPPNDREKDPEIGIQTENAIAKEEEKLEVGQKHSEHENGDCNDSGNDDDDEESATHQDGDDRNKEAENRRLMRMSINTALAIAIHNFPEGLATFVAALADPAVGAVLAVAIAIHNVPEGLCVALPVYYATGNKRNAFLWACVSGAAEPVAALLGWAVLANSFSDTVYAILFGLVSGMMVIISIKELLPTAHRYDPEDTVVTYAFMIGMAIMALSLVLFVL